MMVPFLRLPPRRERWRGVATRSYLRSATGAWTSWFYLRKNTRTRPNLAAQQVPNRCPFVNKVETLALQCLSPPSPVFRAHCVGDIQLICVLVLTLPVFDFPTYLHDHDHTRHTMQGPFERLQGAVDNAGLLASPSTSVDSKGTGATGSTEAPGAATQSLIASITGSGIRRTTPTISLSAKSFNSSATTPWEDVANGRSASGGDRPSGEPHRVAPSSSGDSWSDVGRSSQPWADVRGDAAGNVEDASAGVEIGRASCRERVS